MWKDSISLDETIAFLNSLLPVNEPALRNLVEHRVACDSNLADHPTIQVQDRPGPGNLLCVGFLGVLNGLFGADEEGWGAITAYFEDDGTLDRFERTADALTRARNALGKARAEREELEAAGVAGEEFAKAIRAENSANAAYKVACKVATDKAE